MNGPFLYHTNIFRFCETNTIHPHGYHANLNYDKRGPWLFVILSSQSNGIDARKTAFPSRHMDLSCPPCGITPVWCSVSMICNTYHRGYLCVPGGLVVPCMHAPPCTHEVKMSARKRKKASEIKPRGYQRTIVRSCISIRFQLELILTNSLVATK